MKVWGKLRCTLMLGLFALLPIYLFFPFLSFWVLAFHVKRSHCIVWAIYINIEFCSVLFSDHAIFLHQGNLHLKWCYEEMRTSGRKCAKVGEQWSRSTVRRWKWRDREQQSLYFRLQSATKRVIEDREEKR